MVWDLMLSEMARVDKSLSHPELCHPELHFIAKGGATLFGPRRFAPARLLGLESTVNGVYSCMFSCGGASHWSPGPGAARPGHWAVGMQF